MILRTSKLITNEISIQQNAPMQEATMKQILQHRFILSILSDHLTDVFKKYFIQQSLKVAVDFQFYFKTAIEAAYAVYKFFKPLS